MIEAVPYDPGRQAQWDEFAAAAKNGMFLFQRGFQDYHKDRFPDCSLMFFERDRLVGLLPASRAGDEVVAHGGLTYGAVLSGVDMTTAKMLAVFDAMLEELRQLGARRLVYKTIPIFCHRYPAQEDLYALFRNGARIVRRDVGYVLQPSDKPRYASLRERSLKKAAKAGLTLVESDDCGPYWTILAEVLQARHGTQPVHTLQEIELLKSRFPANIKLFTAELNGEPVAGTLVFEDKLFAHSQYIAAGPVGRDARALDFVYDQLINRIYVDKPWFSFGAATEDQGRVLNAGLADWKEGFGARATMLDFYALDL